MHKYSLALFLIFTVFIIPACSKSTASTNPDHKVDHNDIIYGDLSAPHEMIWYFSPGCSHCIRDFESNFSKIKKEYVDKGKLKIVFREIPVITNFTTNTEQRRRSVENSFLIAKTFRCEAKFNGNDAYPIAFNNLIQSMREVMAQKNFYRWPHIDTPTLEKIFFALGEKNTITVDQYQSCLKNPISREFTDIFQRNTDLLTKELNNSSLPSYYLNNNRIVGMHKNAPPQVIKTLKQVIDKEE